MSKFKWYRALLGGIWFFNMYVDVFEKTHNSKWEREWKDYDFNYKEYTVKKEVYPKRF